MKANKELLIGLAVAFVISVALSLFFVSPVLKGKELKQFDITQFKGSAQEILDYKEKGEQILWTNSMFSGMPAYMLYMDFKTNAAKFVRDGLVTFLPDPAPKIFLLFFGFYIMLLCIRVDPWISLGGAAAFAFSSYFIIILAAGHNNKVIAISFLPILFGGLFYAYRRNPFVGAAIFTGGMALEIVANHPQMTYYFGFLAVAFVITEGISAAISGKIKQFAIASGLVLLGTVFAVGTNYSTLKVVNDYGKFSTRSESELTLNGANKTSGLDRDYITGWSNGIGETFSLLIPNFKGGGSSHKPTAKGNNPSSQMVDQLSGYWGDQPGIGGPVYVGAFILVLFFFALIFVKDHLKWPVLLVTILVVMMSWGSNFPFFTNLLIDYLPLYSKFRAVASVLVIANLAIPLFAVYGLSQMAEQGKMNESVVIFGQKLSFSWLNLFFVIAGFFILLTTAFALAPGTFTSLFATGEVESLTAELSSRGADNGFINDMLVDLEISRASVLSADAFRSLAIIIIGTALIWAYVKFNINKYILAGSFLLLTLGDLYTLDFRYLNDSNFVTAKKSQNKPWPKTASDEYILSDTDPYYRTVNLSVSTFNDATTSFYHKSLGGYHGAKLKIYQELIQYELSDELMNVQVALQKNPTEAGFDEAMKNAPALNMLNTKYFIFGPNGPSSVLRNKFALGNAWFPNQMITVQTADEEISGLRSIDPKQTVLIRKNYSDILAGVPTTPDSISTVTLKSYHPETLTYEVNAATDKIMVMSEIWYPDGWKAFIDGNEVPIARANYVLRAIKIPAGKHTVEMSFITDFKKSETVALVFSILTVGFIVLLLFSGKIKFMKNLVGNDE